MIDAQWAPQQIVRHDAAGISLVHVCAAGSLPGKRLQRILFSVTVEAIVTIFSESMVIYTGWWFHLP